MPIPDNDTKSLLAYDDTVVALDLGSNSFHLLQARLGAGGSLEPLTILAQKVQLGLDMVDSRLSAGAIERGLTCLQDFAAYTRGRPETAVRIVGTQALREACNRELFIAQASAVLQQDIEIISGEEEAVLVYLGVEAALSPSQSVLVVDIGGGSTELAAAKTGTVKTVATVPAGCVSYLDYFPDGTISEAAMMAAQAAAAEQFTAIAGEFSGTWQVAVGCSGTLLAVGDVLLQQGWLQQGDSRYGGSRAGISRSGLEVLRSALLAFDSIDAIQFRGLSEDRRSIFASGVAIVSALFDALAIDHMQLSSAGLREGLAWGLLHP